jgi:hypothetical protein
MENNRPWIPEGLAAGFIGYVTVLAFFGLLNLADGASAFRTAEELGRALFYGNDPGAAGAGPIISYNGIHLLVSLCIGMGAAWLVFQTEKNRPFWFLVFFIFLSGFIYSVAMMGVVASEMAAILSWPVIVLANLAAGATAGGFLWWRHRKPLVVLTEEE